MEKYYEPLLEEFHLGFEYELLVPNGNYVSLVFGVNEIIHSELEQFKDDLTKIAHAITRVKYLDISDIHILGWKFIYNQNNSDYFKLSTGNAIKDTKDNWWSFRLEKDLRVFIQQYEHTRFLGIIKNKSELKKLMLQLGITNE